MTNEQLVSEYKKTGDKRYIDELYLKNEKMLWKIANEFKVDIDETYIGFMESVRRYEQGRAKFTTLMYMCVSHHIMQDKRKKKLETTTLDKEIGDEITIEDTIASDYDLEQEMNNKLLAEHYLSKLSLEERTIVKLYYFNDLTFKQIASKLGLSARQVQSRHEKAMNKLRGLAYNGK